jgi:alpha,alpha-trehalase
MHDGDRQLLQAHLDEAADSVVKPASGILRHDYLVPAGPYREQWDWDGFFMALALMQRKPENAVYLRNWALNYLEHADEDGRVPGCLTPEGPDPRVRQMKPFLAQGVLLASTALGDFTWYPAHWNELQRIVTYRERHGWCEELGLATWYDGMESGMDNNVAVLEYPVHTVVAADLNAYLYAEYRAIAELAERAGKPAENERFAERAAEIKERMNRFLYSPEEAIYYNVFSVNRRHIRRVSVSSFVPLWAGLAEGEQAQATIRRYLLDADQLLSPVGIRSLSRRDFTYNNCNIIKPHSNWQGPVWVLATYLCLQGMLRYGFAAQAQEIADSLIAAVARDIRETGGMHENYHAEIGEGLAAPEFFSWNILLPYLTTELEPIPRVAQR